MSVRWLLAAVHLLAFGIGLGAVGTRARALRGPFDRPGLRRTFSADSWWGLAALLWISTGLVRAFAGYEKGTSYYLHNKLFLLKLALVGGILALELMPLVGLLRWRAALARGAEPDTRLAMRYHRISQIEAVLVVLIVILAAGVARGVGSGGQ